METPGKKSIAKKIAGKVGNMADTVFSGVKAAGKAIGNILPTFSKTRRHIERKKTHSHTIFVSKKGIDKKKRNPRQSLSTTYVIRHVDIDKCDSVSISVTSKSCRLSKAHLFVRYM